MLVRHGANSIEVSGVRPAQVAGERKIDGFPLAGAREIDGAEIARAHEGGESTASVAGDICTRECVDRRSPPAGDSPSLDEARDRALSMTEDP